MSSKYVRMCEWCRRTIFVWNMYVPHTRRLPSQDKPSPRHIPAEYSYMKCRGTRKGRPISINLRNYPSPSVGAREDDVEKGGPSWSPVGMGCAARSSRSQQGKRPRSHPRRVTMKVTPTDHPASCLSSWLRLMPIQVDKSAPTDVRIISLHAIKHPLRQPPSSQTA